MSADRRSGPRSGARPGSGARPSPGPGPGTADAVAEAGTSVTDAAAVAKAAADPARFSFRAVDPAADAGLIHSWVTHPKASFWLMAEASALEVREAYTAVADSPYRGAFIGSYDGRPAVLMERYDPAHAELVGFHHAEPGDVGMHFLVAPSDTPVHGFTRAAIRAVLTELFADPGTRRVVVEPDVRNGAVHALNTAVGFRVLRRISTPEKDALLSVCTREQFEVATR